VVIDPDQLSQRTVTVVSQPNVSITLGIEHEQASNIVPEPAAVSEAPLFTSSEERKVAQFAYEVIRKLQNQPQTVPSIDHIFKPEIQEAIIRDVSAKYQSAQLSMDAVIEPPDIAKVVEKTAQWVEKQTIGIHRILVVPKEEIKCGFKSFRLKLDALKYPAVSEELWIQYLRTGGTEIMAPGRGKILKSRLEDTIVNGFVDFNDVSYDDHANILYDLAEQTVKQFLGYLSEQDVRRVLRCYQRDITRFIHAQMQEHYWEEATDYEVKISKGFTELKPSAYTAPAGEEPLDFRQLPDDKSNMAKYLFGGFQRCLYPVQKFQSDTENWKTLKFRQNRTPQSSGASMHQTMRQGVEANHGGKY
jgi:type III restriction enzyme